MADAINPPDLWQPFGPFSQIAIQGNGIVVHLKGQVALDRAGTVIGGGDMRAQLRQVLENIRAALASVGGEMGDILSMTNYVTDMDAFLANSCRRPIRLRPRSRSRGFMIARYWWKSRSSPRFPPAALGGHNSRNGSGGNRRNYFPV